MSTISSYIEFETEEEAREAAQQFLRDFPPFGYDSSYQVWQVAGSTKWMLQTYRATSCD